MLNKICFADSRTDWNSESCWLVRMGTLRDKSGDVNVCGGPGWISTVPLAVEVAAGRVLEDSPAICIMVSKVSEIGVVVATEVLVAGVGFESALIRSIVLEPGFNVFNMFVTGVGVKMFEPT